MVKILNGKALSEELLVKLRAKVGKGKKKPKLVIIQVGSLERSNAYIKRKVIFGERLGVLVDHKRYLEKVSTKKLIKDIEILNTDKSVDGIIVQLPLPEHVDKDAVIEAINPTKDVDGLTSKTLFTPATAKGILTLLDYYKVKIKGKKVVMVGKSQLVGLPIALSLLNRHATVTVCHKQTRNLSQETRQADILIVATGVPGLITPKHVSKGQVVIDVGITVLRNKKVVGDVDFENVSKIVQAITPVPGGVGPMTVYSLFENLLKACLRRQAYELNSSKR